MIRRRAEYEIEEPYAHTGNKFIWPAAVWYHWKVSRLFRCIFDCSKRGSGSARQR